MLGPGGNPRANSIFGIIKVLQTYEKINLLVKANKVAA